MNNDNKSYFEYLIIISKVFRDKCYYTMFRHFDLFEKVERIYPNDKYYAWKDLIDQPNHIIDNIYLGSAFNAADEKWLKNNDIGVIVNTTESISNFFPEQFTYYNYPAEDLESGSLSKYYDKFVETVKTNKDKKILVHCYAGRSRSASLVLYYLIKYHDMSLCDALEYLKSKRKIVNINQEFVQEISKSVQ